MSTEKHVIMFGFDDCISCGKVCEIIRWLESICGKVDLAVDDNNGMNVMVEMTESDISDFDAMGYDRYISSSCDMDQTKEHNFLIRG